MAPELRALKGRVCYRGDSAKTAEGKLALYQTLAASPASIVAANSVISFGLFGRTQVVVGRRRQGLSPIGVEKFGCHIHPSPKRAVA